MPAGRGLPPSHLDAMAKNVLVHEADEHRPWHRFILNPPLLRCVVGILVTLVVTRGAVVLR